MIPASDPQRDGSFVLEGRADVAVVIVTYNNADDVDGLISSLRAEAADTTIRVIVADNSSSDDTVSRLRVHSDVLTVPTGGNLGYSAGINVAAAHAGDYGALLILNPDLRVHRGAVAALLQALRVNPRAGVIAPRILDDSGRTAISLFNEPTAFRALVDSLLGSIWRNRAAAMSEWIRDPADYERARAVDWATGAALLVSRAAAAIVGEWDERFFLYSEETDYCRRVRDAGLEVRYEPAAVVHHSQGKSGTSLQLEALMSVNRVRYMRKHSPYSAELYRRAALIGALLRRRGSASHTVSARYLQDERLWPELPRGTWNGVRDGRSASIVIPAHNEERVIARTLRNIDEPTARGALEVVVACNGCSDDTAARASEFAAVRVLERAEASKPVALNAGDDVASVWPRIYLDADIDFPPAALPALLRALGTEGVCAGRPPFEYDTRDATRIVRAYYRARMRVPALSSALWGAGVYAVNERGHERLGTFPDLTADDVYVDRMFSPSEKRIPLAPPVRVRTPRRTEDLLQVLVRGRRGPSEQGVDSGRSTAAALLRTVRGPVSLWDAATFAALTLLARSQAMRVPTTAPAWERDESTR